VGDFFTHGPLHIPIFSPTSASFGMVCGTCQEHRKVGKGMGLGGHGRNRGHIERTMPCQVGRLCPVPGEGSQLR
jgi:hypothetical protein